MWCIYKHENKYNSKVYIGQTIHQDNPQLRWDYGNGYKQNEQNKFYNAIKKYGWNGFTHEIIERDIPTQKETNKREIYWINYYDSYRYGYNSTPGGNCVRRNVSGHSNHMKPVVCYETQETFACARLAAEAKKINVLNIKECCKGKTKTAGGFHWCYCENIDTFVPLEPEKPKIKTFKVLNEQTKEVFDSIQLAAEKSGMSYSQIKSRCDGKIVNNKTWFYYDKELRDKHPQKLPAVNCLSKEKRKVICIEDEIIFENVYSASVHYGTSYSKINQSCLKLKGFNDNKKFKHCMFLDEFKKKLDYFQDKIKEEI